MSSVVFTLEAVQLSALHEPPTNEVIAAGAAPLSPAVRGGSAAAPASVAPRRDRRHRQRDPAARERSGAAGPVLHSVTSDLRDLLWVCTVMPLRTDHNSPPSFDSRRATRWTLEARSRTRSGTTALTKVKDNPETGPEPARGPGTAPDPALAFALALRPRPRPNSNSNLSPNASPDPYALSHPYP